MDTVGLPGLPAIRKRAGWSQVEVARRLQVSSNSVYRWEAGTRDCRPFLLKALIAVFAAVNIAVTESDLLNAPQEAA